MKTSEQISAPSPYTECIFVYANTRRTQTQSSTKAGQLIYILMSVETLYDNFEWNYLQTKIWTFDL